MLFLINLATENKVGLRAVVGLKFIAFYSATAHTLQPLGNIQRKLIAQTEYIWFLLTHKANTENNKKAVFFKRSENEIEENRN